MQVSILEVSKKNKQLVSLGDGLIPSTGFKDAKGQSIIDGSLIAVVNERGAVDYYLVVYMTDANDGFSGFTCAAKLHDNIFESTPSYMPIFNGANVFVCANSHIDDLAEFPFEETQEEILNYYIKNTKDA